MESEVQHMIFQKKGKSTYPNIQGHAMIIKLLWSEFRLHIVIFKMSKARISSVYAMESP